MLKDLAPDFEGRVQYFVIRLGSLSHFRSSWAPGCQQDGRLSRQGADLPRASIESQRLDFGRSTLFFPATYDPSPVRVKNVMTTQRGKAGGRPERNLVL